MADTSISHLFYEDAETDTTVLEFPNQVEGPLADLLAAASGPAMPEELSGEAQARAIFASTAANWSKPKRRVRPARMAVVAVSAASLLATTTTVLAAASVLPSPAANIVDKALQHVDINVSPPVPSQLGGSAQTPPPSNDVPATNPTLPTSNPSTDVAPAAQIVQPAAVDPAPTAPNAANPALTNQAAQAAVAAATGHSITVSSGTGDQGTGSGTGDGATYMGGNQSNGSGDGTGGGSTGGQTIPVNQGGTTTTPTTGGTTPTTGSTTPPVTKGPPPSVVNQAPPTGSGEVAPTAGGNQGSGTVEQEVNGAGTQNSASSGPSGTNEDDTTANQ
jgi:hypothetical protein